MLAFGGGLCSEYLSNSSYNSDDVGDICHDNDVQPLKTLRHISTVAFLFCLSWAETELFQETVRLFQ